MLSFFRYPKWYMAASVVGAVHFVILLSLFLKGPQKRLFQGQLVDTYAMGDGLGQYIPQAKVLFEGRLVDSHIAPLYPFLIRVGAIFTSYDISALLIPHAFHVLTGIALGKILWEMSEKRYWFLAIVGTLVPPSFLTWSSITTADSLGVFFAVLTFYFMTKSREKGMLFSAFLAISSHIINTLLFFPILFHFAKKNPGRLWLAFTPVVGVVLLAIYYAVSNGVFNEHGVIAIQYASNLYGDRLPIFGYYFSYPFAGFAGLIYSQGVTFATVAWSLFMIGTYGLYWLGAYLSYKRKSILALTQGLPYLILVSLIPYHALVPRFAIYAFPLLFVYREYLRNKTTVSIVVIIASLAVLLGMIQAGQLLGRNFLFRLDFV